MRLVMPVHGAALNPQAVLIPFPQVVGMLLNISIPGPFLIRV